MIRAYFFYFCYLIPSGFFQQETRLPLIALHFGIRYACICAHLYMCMCVCIHSWSLAYMSLRRSRIIRGRDKRYKLRTRDCQPVKSTHAEIPRSLLLVEFAEFPRDTIEKPTKRALRSRVQVFFF